ncbi:MAG: FecR domain-containing protein [Kiritimatiellae bacterium]|nr:FecR domain-containing protein [Kiritimatiellia bacterium]
MPAKAHIEFERYLAGDMSAPETERFLGGVERSPEDRRRLARLIEDQALLFDILHERAAARRPHASARRTEPAARPSSAAKLLPRVERRAPWARWVTAAAAVLLIGVALLVREHWAALTHLTLAPPVARIERARGEIWTVSDGTRRRAQAGESLRVGQELQTASGAGLAVVACEDGTRAELSPDTAAAFAPASSRHVTYELLVTRGTLSASVAAQPPGKHMLVRSPHVDIAVLGTRFVLAVRPGASRVTMQEGEVRIRNRNTGETALLHAGDQAVVDNQRVHIAARPQIAKRLPPTGTAQRPVVVGFTLINADTNLPIPGFDPMAQNAVLNLGTLPTTNVAIRADTSPRIVKAVALEYDGQPKKGLEGVYPYMLWGDSLGVVSGYRPTPGWHTVKAVPYGYAPGEEAADTRTPSIANAPIGVGLTLRFLVIDTP